MMNVAKQSEFCINLLGNFKTDRPNNGYIVMPLADRSLGDVIEQGPQQLHVIRDWGHQIALGVQFLHQSKLCHRDLKSPNILIVSDQPKIADFGQCTPVTRKRFSYGGTFGYNDPSLRVMYDDPFEDVSDGKR